MIISFVCIIVCAREDWSMYKRWIFCYAAQRMSPSLRNSGVRLIRRRSHEVPNSSSILPTNSRAHHANRATPDPTPPATALPTHDEQIPMFDFCDAHHHCNLPDQNVLIVAPAQGCYEVHTARTQSGVTVRKLSQGK